jgi:CHAD domain-containing protein
MKPSIDESYKFLAARYLREQARRLAGELVGVRRAEDAEFVHQARIVSRRLRAAIGIFKPCLPKKTARRWRKSIRRITVGLGTARDCDVHVKELSEMLAKLNNRKSGAAQAGRRRGAGRAIAWMLADLERKREVCQRDVLQEVDRIEKDGVLEEILHAAKEMLVDADEGAPCARRETVYSPEVFRRFGAKIIDKQRRLKSLSGCLESRKNKKRHHEMRIAAKRLRYTMEIAGPAYSGRLGKSFEVVKKLQALLGDIHDLDLWEVRLEEFERDRRLQVKKAYGTDRPFAELKDGFSYLRRRCRRIRDKRFAELVEFWKVLRRRGLWKKLEETIRRGSKKKSVKISDKSRLAKRETAQHKRHCLAGKAR